MPENDFEKQVQQLFDDLKLKPSAEVWPRVQERISKEKRRRRFVLWIPLLLLVLGAGGYWLFENRNINNPAEQRSITKHNTTTTEDDHNNNRAIENEDNNALKEKPEQNVAAPVASIDEHKDKSSGEATDQGIASTGNDPKHEPRAGKNNINAAIPLKKKSSINNSTVNDNNIARHAETTKISPQKDAGNAVVPAKGNKQTPRSGSSVGSIKDNATGLDYASNRMPPMVTAQTVDPARLLLPVIEAEKHINAYPVKNIYDDSNAIAVNTKMPAVKLSKKKTWEWGIEGGAGVSELGNGLSDIFSGISSSDKTLLTNSFPGSPNPGIANLNAQNNTPLAAALPPAPSTVKPGFSWSGGAFAKWHLKSKLAVTTGLRYTYFSTSRQVGYIANNNFTIIGASQDASARFAGYYSGAYSDDYTNKYHFIEMPIGIQWQMNKGIKLPLQLDAGITVAWLANTNGLHYNTSTGAYYEDKTLFNKVQTGLYAGVSAKLFQHHHRPLYIGPVFQYNLSNMLKVSSGSPQNFIYGGIKAQWVLWKK